ncbi:hypothetical protein PRIPAC_88825 [Pristionchus pacificus]|uniref:Uncharacterized protein n=1 Tax=Pristionchus pacificus TaxID=54126 RepID=A0A2A6B786_PRIPA|nr:hypothetical protein PRIPAC_88825 [Pristionchus pacificus]|eukprot:PDM61731.1 hypothetical protein PRIPAC_51173 [Pristionchus pacificus]
MLGSTASCGINAPISVLFSSIFSCLQIDEKCADGVEWCAAVTVDIGKENATFAFCDTGACFVTHAMDKDFVYSNRLDIRRIYWMFGFAGEFLSQLLKQPVKLELAFVESEKDCAYNFV